MINLSLNIKQGSTEKVNKYIIDDSITFEETSNPRDDHAILNTHVNPITFFGSCDCHYKPVSQKYKYLNKIENNRSYNKIKSVRQSANLNRLAFVLNVPTHIKYQALNILQKVIEQNLCKGKHAEDVAGHILFITCIANHFVIFFTQIIDQTYIEKYDHNIADQIKKQFFPKYVPLSVKEYITYYCNSLDINTTYKEVIKQNYNKYNKLIENKGLSNAITAGALIYISLKQHEKIGYKQFAEKLYIKESTLRDRVNMLLNLS